MKKMICLLTVLLLCCSLVMPAFAATDAFVPSITYKDGPTLSEADMGGENVKGCVVITSILKAKNKSTDIYQERRDQLLDIYDLIKKGEMELPVDKSYEVLELVDVSHKKTDCIEAGHTHEEELNKEEVFTTVKLKEKVAKDTVVKGFVYDAEAEKWVELKSVKNNGNGTLTCEFDFFGTTMFCVERGAATETPKTGDAAGQNLGLWIGIMGVCAVALVGVMVIRKKKA